jgi:hypothetical protein
MRRVKFMIPAVGATVFMVTGLVAPAGAASPPGRGASSGGLTNALIKQTAVQDDVGNVIPTENVTLNLIMAQDPDQPGVTPGGRGVEP